MRGVIRISSNTITHMRMMMMRLVSCCVKFERALCTCNNGTELSDFGPCEYKADKKGGLIRPAQNSFGRLYLP